MFTRAKEPRIFIITSRLYEAAGGRTKATITRTMFLQKRFDTTLVEMSATKYPGEELSKVFAKYQTKFNVINPWHITGKTSHRTKNYLEFLKEQTGSLGDATLFIGAQEVFTLPTLSGGTIKSYVEDGSIARLRVYHPDGKVDFLALDDRQNIFLRELYDKDSLIARYYLDDSGKVCAGFVVNENDSRKYLYRTKDDTLVYSESVVDHNVAFLNDTLRDGDVVISDVRYYDEALERLKPKIRTIHVWHEIATNLSNEVGVNPAYARITDQSFPLLNSDKIVVFTDDARDEYAAKFPHLKNKIAVIPYGIDVKRGVNDVNRDNDLVVSMGRLTPAKNVDAQIRAFAIFHKKYPTTKLHIFGEGGDKGNLQQIIQELGLSKSVKLRGFSHNTDERFQHAAMTVFSSNNETFGLTILESLSNGTPVASYNVRFGAKMMIENARNGMIAKKNTPEALAKAMIKLRESELPPQQVRNSIKHTFSRKGFENAWLALISDKAEK